MNEIGLSDYHEGNLRRLAAYLRGPLRARFDMGTFAAPGYERTDKEAECCLTECGSVGCAIGHAPFVGIRKSRDEDWDRYSERVFGLLKNAKDGKWNWCFSCEWGAYDNTPTGAASRIEWILDGHDIIQSEDYVGYATPKHVPFEVVVLRPTFAEPLEVA